MRIKATIVAYAFSVQYFENTTIVTYAGLKVKCLDTYTPKYTTPTFITEVLHLVSYAQLF